MTREEEFGGFAGLLWDEDEEEAQPSAEGHLRGSPWPRPSTARGPS